jgi:hypothetical protein
MTISSQMSVAPFSDGPQSCRRAEMLRQHLGHIDLATDRVQFNGNSVLSTPVTIARTITAKRILLLEYGKQQRSIFNHLGANRTLLTYTSVQYNQYPPPCFRARQHCPGTCVLVRCVFFVTVVNLSILLQQQPIVRGKFSMLNWYPGNAFVNDLELALASLDAHSSECSKYRPRTQYQRFLMRTA